MRDAELCGDATGVLDVGDAAAPGVGLAAPELERDAGDVVARSSSSAAATEESTPPLIATRTRSLARCSRRDAGAAEQRDRVGIDVERGVDVGVGRRVARG